MEIVQSAGYKLDKDMDESLWEGKYHMFERIPQDGSVNEAGLRLVIEEKKETGKLPSRFTMNEILITRFVKEAADSVNQRFGAGYE